MHINPVIPLAERTLDIMPPPRTVFGAGAARQLPDLVRSLGGKAAFIVTDPGLVKVGIASSIEGILTKAGIPTARFDGVDANPHNANIEAGSAAVHAAGLDAVVIIALGGGSAMDAAKGIALHVTNGGEVASLDYRNPLAHPALPIIAIPTTAGTGSEQNSYGVITDLNARRKYYVGNASAQPQIALLDPELTLGLPPNPTAWTGMDTLIHAIESLASWNANPYADAIDLQVIGMVGEWLPKAYANPTDLEARSNMLLASSIVALAYRSGTGMGLVHAIGHSLGGRLNAPHGQALSIVLADVLRFNCQAPGAQAKYARAAFALKVGNTNQSEAENAAAAIQAIEALVRRVGITQTLRDLGVTSDDIVEQLVADTLEDAVLYNNPIQPTADDVRAIIRRNQ